MFDYPWGEVQTLAHMDAGSRGKKIKTVCINFILILFQSDKKYNLKGYKAKLHHQKVCIMDNQNINFFLYLITANSAVILEIINSKPLKSS